MKYIAVRLGKSDHNWKKPSPGRLGMNEAYVGENGYGLEDWNFNTNLAINGYIYGYTVVRPRQAYRNDEFNILFLTYHDGQWFSVGAYNKCKFVEDPSGDIPDDIIEQKAKDLLDLQGRNSLSGDLEKIPFEKLKELMRHDSQYLKWKVRTENVLVFDKPKWIEKLPINPIWRESSFTYIDKGIFDYCLGTATHTDDASTDNEEYDRLYEEGRIIDRRHLARERNRRLIEDAKQKFASEHNGRLFCEVCGFDFEKVYGKLGEGFIEGHHKIPLAELDGVAENRVEDIALLCSNCHSMIHAQDPWLTIEQLRQRFEESREN